MSSIYRIYDGGHGLGAVKPGLEVYDPEDGAVLVVTGEPSIIHTGDPRGNYVQVTCAMSPRDSLDITDAEFEAIMACEAVRL